MDGWMDRGREGEQERWLARARQTAVSGNNRTTPSAAALWWHLYLKQCQLADAFALVRARRWHSPLPGRCRLAERSVRVHAFIPGLFGSVWLPMISVFCNYDRALSSVHLHTFIHLSRLSARLCHTDRYKVSLHSGSLWAPYDKCLLLPMIGLFCSV